MTRSEKEVERLRRPVPICWHDSCEAVWLRVAVHNGCPGEGSRCHGLVFGLFSGEYLQRSGNLACYNLLKTSGVFAYRQVKSGASFVLPIFPLGQALFGNNEFTRGGGMTKLHTTSSQGGGDPRRAPRNTILTGDALTRLRELPGESVDCVVTSPPYFQLRDYGVPGQLGMEPTIGGWVADLRQVLREVARVLTPTGSLWLNLGDSFSRHEKYGAPPKGLLLAPERLLLALAQDGWLVRTKVIWAKTNPMPSSVTDRLSLTYEVIYFLVRRPQYFFDLDAIREPHRSAGAERERVVRQEPPIGAGPLAGTRNGLRELHARGRAGHAWGRTRETCGRWQRRGIAGRTSRRSRLNSYGGRFWRRVRLWCARRAGAGRCSGQGRCNVRAKRRRGGASRWTRFSGRGRSGWWLGSWAEIGWASS
jgi:DNA methylase